MAVFLFNEIIFGPVKSRRLGASLGINLLPTNSKLCTFNCIYCECGWTPERHTSNFVYTPVPQITEALEKKLQEIKEQNSPLDMITFAGNGEPTMHPGFPEIIDATVSLRNKYFPEVKIAVLSNSTMLFKPKVVEALKKIEQNILKLDSAFEDTIEILNCPIGEFSVAKTVENLKKFNGQLILQTMFIRGTYKGRFIDNTTKREYTAWMKMVKEINPRQIMIYTISRDTPASGLVKVPLEELETIAGKIKKEGFDVQVSG